jgi:predicted N-formylglutamate amidohydrolase
MAPAILIEGVHPDLLLIADHASNHIPEDIELGIAPELLDQHIAVDIGVMPLAEMLCGRLGCAAVLGGVSRLVIDYNRELHAHGLIPETSDGAIIPGNTGLDQAKRDERIGKWWRPYHATITDRIAEMNPRMLVSLHSFTPRLSAKVEERPWQVGVLYNEDERAARIAIPLLEARGIVTGDNLPYSGKLLNATMNRHAEGNGIAYLGLEVRQDLISDPAGVAHWADILTPIIAETAESLA